MSRNNIKPLFFIFCFILLFMFTCRLCKRSKKGYKRTTEVCNNLYVEVYNVFAGGVYGADLVSDYLTDSINFRIYIGSYSEDDEHITFICDKDSIIIKKINKENSDTFITIKKEIFLLSDLKKGHKFE